MLKRFRPDDPAFLEQIESRLKAVLQDAHMANTGLLSVTLALPETPCAGLPGPFHELFYWSRPAAQHEILGLGAAVTCCAEGEARWSKLSAAFDIWRKHWRHEDADHTGLHPLAVGGFAFAAKPDDSTILPSARLSVPELLMQRRGEICALTFTFSSSPDDAAIVSAMARLRQLMTALIQKIRPVHTSRPLQRIDDKHADQAWLGRATLAVHDIRSGKLDKVVLSRRVSFRAKLDFDPARVMADLEQQHPSCALFATDTADGGVFLGASPETLVRLQNGDVYCDALAGTAWGEGRATFAADQKLLADVKNGREHRLVVQAIAEVLRPVCARLEVPDAPQIRRLGRLRHLWSSLHGRVKSGISLLDLLQRVHPTPAVGGYPRKAALDWLSQQGEQREAWYTGAIGWLDCAGNGEFAVALRCAHLQGQVAHLYAGAGIVAGSEPQRELAETEAKLSAMLQVLGHIEVGNG
ncbi:MAG: isochorismate synthase [Sulfurimicrobium sp.]|jgi:isochorismate synthase|nr:isochorismate synthase [Sulfurimicrobium sp.]MDZ7657485.1 isochorismate synthase [Sulfurimicrobium sp.]